MICGRQEVPYAPGIYTCDCPQHGYRDPTKPVDDEVLPLDPTCPICRGPHFADDVYDGSERQCRSCGHTLVCVTYTDGTARMQCYASCQDCRWYARAWRWLRSRLYLLRLRLRG